MISRPNSLGSSVGITISDSYEDLQLNVKSFHKRYPQQELLISEYISGGVEITCGCLQRKDGSFISLPPVEIIPQGHVFFDYESKYDVGGAEEIIPPVSYTHLDVYKRQMSSRYISAFILLLCLLIFPMSVKAVVCSGADDCQNKIKEYEEKLNQAKVDVYKRQTIYGHH